MVPFTDKEKRVMFVLGTRSETVRLAPVIRAFLTDDRIDTKICLTGQHREMLDQVMEIFDFKADFDLDITIPNQTFGDVTWKVIKGLEEIFQRWKPDTVLVQGDTTAVMAASIAAFYNQIEVGHIEAGLRAFNEQLPLPEDVNRCATTQFASIHFAPTMRSKQNLINEGIEARRIHVTGNTVIDALFQALQYLENSPDKRNELESKFSFLADDCKTILVAGHQHENFGDAFLEICDAISDLAEREDVQFVYPVHLKSNVQEPVQRLLSGRKNVFLIEPLDYLSFVYLMQRSDVILTDSNSVQEAAPSLGKPVVVTRDIAERPEAVEAGTVIFAGINHVNIVQNINLLLNNKTFYKKISQTRNPYGDGKASERILRVLQNEEVGVLSMYAENKKSVS
ncbi:MAG: UDP-N-acetylglucosamine 2-epimerase (non-hydrolyzing) [Planctomycetaceae bacterium]|nr:UDP-N-acetylglucosamine 2-epimerase (non-hydrolyzing) [Planctomycetaceae bacterium]